MNNSQTASMDLFDRLFRQRITVCRFAAYYSIAGMVALDEGIDHRTATLTYFLVAPIVVQIIFYIRALRLRTVWMAVFAIECCAVHAVCAGAGLGVISVFGVSTAFLASNTALWGIRWLPMYVCVAALGFVLGLQGDWQIRYPGDPWLSALSGVWALGYVFILCALAHQQAQRLLRARSTLKTENQTLLRYLPEDVRGHLRTARQGSIERVWITVAFVDLVGFTRATRELPAEVLATVLNDFLTQVNTQVKNWGGSVSKFLGDGVLCVFAPGQESSRKNNALQCVHCMEYMPSILCDLNGHWRTQGYLQSFSIACGIASGYCAVGDWGGRNRWDYTVIGEPVNLACRLQDSASCDMGILLDEVTASLVRDKLDVGSRIELDLSGVGEVTAHELNR